MNKIKLITIKQDTQLIIMIGLLLFSLFISAAEEAIKPTQNIQALKPNTTQQVMLYFKTYAENDQDKALIKILEETQFFNRVKKIIETNFVLSKPFHIHIQHQQESKFVTTELSQPSHIVTIPFSFIHTLYQGLLNKYEHQSEIINIIFSASMEFYIWSEFSAYLIKDKHLEVMGDKFTTMDNFSSIMMLNQNNPSSDYIADASEAYLLIRSADNSSVGQHNISELQQDQQRYRHIICLSLGFDQLTQPPEIDKSHLQSFAWDEKEIQQCKQNYRDILSNWYAAISPYLTANNLITHWLNQR